MGMSADLSSILKLEVPLIVQIAQRAMAAHEVFSLEPGAIIELPKTAEEPLDVLINNRIIGQGQAVKVGENFGIRMLVIGDMSQRVEALGSGSAAVAGEPEIVNDPLTEQLIADL
jgi:flagellar motor switch protein FliN/FliY